MRSKKRLKVEEKIIKITRGPCLAIFVENGFAASLLEAGFGDQNGGRESSNEDPRETKRGPRASQDRFFGCLFSMSISSSIFHRFGDGLGMVFGIKKSRKNT